MIGRRSGDGEPLFLEELAESDAELYILLEPLQILGKNRIVLSGPNGSGKTTLLKLLRSTLQEDLSNDLVEWGNDFRIGWFDQQDESLQIEEQVLNRCHMHFPDDRDESKIRSNLANAGIPTEDLVKKMSQLSYGQRVKIRFLQLMLSAYDLLILDEPTNHLDIETRESLENMIQQYE